MAAARQSQQRCMHVEAQARSARAFLGQKASIDARQHVFGRVPDLSTVVCGALRRGKVYGAGCAYRRRPVSNVNVQ